MDGSSFPEDEYSGLSTEGSIDVAVATCPATDVEIAMFFDGTGNNLANVEEGDAVRSDGGTLSEGSYNNDLSNVAKLYKNHLMIRDEVSNDCGGIGKLRYREIIDGIGTTSGQDDNTFGNALGWGATGVEERVKEGFLRFLQHINAAKARGEVRSIKVDVFGFSRGSAAARHFVNCVRRGHAGHGYGGPYHEVQEEDKPKIEIRFLGIFDTVVSWGLVANDSGWGPLRITLPDDIATKIVHITALDEFRENFPLTEAPVSAETIRMPGAHSDIGGGYPDFWNERVKIRPGKLEGGTLPFAQPDVVFHPNLSADEEAIRLDLIANNWISKSDTNAFTREYKQVAMGPAPSYEINWYLTRPWLNHRLSHVALRVMHQKAIEAGVPFPSLPEDDNHAINDSTLLALADSLMEGVEINEAASVTYRRSYIHHSSHWKQSGPFYAMKPHEGGSRRTVYNNDGSLQKT